MPIRRLALDVDKVVDRPDLLVSFEELNEMMGIGRIHALEARFVGAAQAMKPAAE